MKFITETRIVCILKKKHWHELNKAGFVGKNLLEKNDYKDGSTFYGLFLAPKKKYC